MRNRKKPWTPTELASNPRIVHEPAAHKGRWNAYFGVEQPLEVEIGCGKGRFITELSRRSPHHNHVAVEREAQVLAAAARSSRSLPAESRLAFIIGDVKDMPDFFGCAEIHRLYINFCDPWPNRKKWHKRRLTHPHFLQMYRTLLAEDGEIHLKTDNKELFGFSLCAFSGEGWQTKNTTLDLHHSGHRGNIMTEYEAKFAAAGQPIYRCEAYRTDPRRRI